MLSLIKSFFAFELTCLWAHGQRYLLLSFFFQGLLMLGVMGIPCCDPLTLSVLGLLVFISLLYFQADTFILHGFKGAHFQNLSLTPSVFPWIMWVKIITLSLGLIGFILINISVWVWGGWMVFQPWKVLILFSPYVMGLHIFVFTLIRGHLQELYIGPLLIMPLEIPIILMCFSKTYHLYSLALLGGVASTFILAWVSSKSIQIQATS